MPIGVLSSRSASAFFRRGGRISRRRASAKSRPPCSRFRPATRPISALSPPRSSPGGDRQKLFLHSSPEFACKNFSPRARPGFSIAKVFRNGERGALHHPEFTMLEWYRAGEDYAMLIEDCARFSSGGGRRRPGSSLFAAVRRCLCRARTTDGGRSLRPLRRHRSSRYARRDGRDATALPRRAVRWHSRGGDDTWADIFSKLLVERIEPNSALVARLCSMTIRLRGRACPAARSTRPRVAERFELYACGVELANGFGELTDPAEQRRRFEGEMAERAGLYGEPYPIDEDFLAALANAASQRHRARLRPARDAGDRGAAYRPGAVDAGRRSSRHEHA